MESILKVFLKIFVLNSVFSCTLAAIRPLSKDRQNIALINGENPDTCYDILEEFRTCVKELPHIKARTDDQFLVTFLRNAKYDIEMAKQKLCEFYWIQRVYPDVFINRNVSNNTVMKDFLDCQSWFLMPQGAKPGIAVFIGRWGAYDPQKLNVDDLGYVGTAAYEILAWENDDAAISGAWVIFDLAGITETHVAKYSSEVFRKYFLINPQMTPIEIKGFHFINTSGFTRIVVEIARHVVEDSLKNKIYVHGHNLTSLYKYVPKDQLPVEYGGTGLSFAELTAKLTEQFVDYADYFDENEKKYGVDKSIPLSKSPILKYFKHYELP